MFKSLTENKAGCYQAKLIKNSEGHTEVDYRKTPWFLTSENTFSFPLMA